MMVPWPNSPKATATITATTTTEWIVSSTLNHLAARAASSSARASASASANANATINIHRLKEDQLDMLHIITIAFSSLSLFAGLVTLNWFYRMRRSFRHE